MASVGRNEILQLYRELWRSARSYKKWPRFRKKLEFNIKEVFVVRRNETSQVQVRKYYEQGKNDLSVLKGLATVSPTTLDIIFSPSETAELHL